MRSIGEKCGVFGVYGKGLDASRLTFFGLYALQHRGQESSGIASTDGKKLRVYKNRGLVSQVFDEKIISSLVGHSAIGHNRYSTSGGSRDEHAQPLLVNRNTVALAHNGNIPSLTLLKEFLAKKKVHYADASDSALIARAIGVLVEEGMTIEKTIKKTFPLMTGAFAVLILTKDKMIAVRDSFGIRPLSIAKLNGGYVFSSETCAFHPIGATFLRDVSPGEMVVVDQKGIHSTTLATANLKLDVFEFVYFARPDSVLLGKSVYEVRKNFGTMLAQEHHLAADVVIPVPETALPVAVGYARESGVPMELGLVKNRYIHRTFIEPEQHIRDQGVKVKLSPLPEVMKGKRVIVIDDSIVRGTTSKQIVKMIFEAGAKEVHFLVSSPPVVFPDFYGIDTPNQSNLLAASKTVEEMREYLGATSLRFLSYEGLIKAVGVPEKNLCTSCFTGVYPLDIKERKIEVLYPSHHKVQKTTLKNVLK